VNDGVTNFNSSIIMNLWTLNEEMGYDKKIKENVEVNDKWIDLKHFKELLNVDKDVVVDKTLV
jgi:hypothetical protein